MSELRGLTARRARARRRRAIDARRARARELERRPRRLVERRLQRLGGARCPTWSGPRYPFHHRLWRIVSRVRDRRDARRGPRLRGQRQADAARTGGGAGAPRVERTGGAPRGGEVAPRERVSLPAALGLRPHPHPHR